METVWTDVLPRLPTESEDVVILASASGEKRVSLRSREQSAAELAPLPLFTDLLMQASPRTFGSDGRCFAERDDSALRLRCRKGQSISGVTLAFKSSRLPADAALDAKLSSAGSREFRAQVTAKDTDAEDLQAVSRGTQRLRLPQLASNLEPQLVIVAPRQGGTLILEKLEIVPSYPTGRVAELSAWAWSPDLWRTNPTGLIQTAQLKGVKRLFVTLEVKDGKLRHAADLRNFVSLAGRGGIKIEAVEGDPRMASVDGLRRALVRARAYAAYQRMSPAATRLAGIQYDVEPYILSEWRGDSVDYNRWANAITRLAEAAGEPVDLVVPFWIMGSGGGTSFLDQVEDFTRGLTVMSYRTDAALLSQVAEPLLAWGSRRGKPVRLALENGPLADESEEIYRPAASGTLALMEGPKPRVVLLKSADVVSGARMYRLTHQSVIHGATLSFLGREVEMKALADRAGAALSAWPAFSGFALHGLPWPVSAAQPPGAP